MAGRCSSTASIASRSSDSEQTRMRRMEIGFVYQFHHLLPEFSALENVVLPQLILGLSATPRPRRAPRSCSNRSASTSAGDHRPAQLSGGEQQRVAIARAVANGPQLLLADEPTGNLDPPTAERVFEQLLKLVRQSGVAAVIATHNLDLAARMDRTLAPRGRPPGRGGGRGGEPSPAPSTATRLFRRLEQKKNINWRDG